MAAKTRQTRLETQKRPGSGSAHAASDAGTAATTPAAWST